MRQNKTVESASEFNLETHGLRQKRRAGMGRIAMAAFGFVLLGGAGAVAGADTEPVIVVPGRPGVPIIINGQDVSGAVIEGDRGLGRPQIGLTIIWPPRQLGYWQRSCGPACDRPSGGFYPRTGVQPRVGRLEAAPTSKRPLPPAETYERAWGIESAPLPATIEQPAPIPPIVIAPSFDRDGSRPGPRPRPPR